MLKNNKVLVVTDFFTPHWTGISKSISHLLSALKNKFQFTVITVKYNSNLSAFERLDGINIYREDFLFSFSRAKYSLKLLFRFINQIRRHNTVLINSPFTNVLPVALLAKIFGKKLIIFHQGDLILPASLFNRIIEVVFNFCTLLACGLANKVGTYTSDYARHSRVLKYFLYKFQPMIIPLQFSTGKSGESKKRNHSKLTKLRKENKILIGFAGRFVEEKGFDVLFKAIPTIVSQTKDVQFVFAGETKIDYEDFFNQQTAIYHQVKKHVTLLGLLSGQELVKFYQTIDLLVVPSRSECFGLVQAEAMLNKKPVVMSNVPGGRDLVDKTGFGLLFKVEDAVDLADNILLAIDTLSDFQKKYPQVKKYLDYERNAKQAAEFISC